MDYRGASDPYRTKDFTLLKYNGVYHLFYILQSRDNADSSTTHFGHDCSVDLKTWQHLPDALPVRSDRWDSRHVWAPHIVQRDSFFMFYTGVSQSGKQSIGLATSTDLANWHRRDAPIFTCEDAPWTWCDSTNATYGEDFRDPFVMPDPDSTGHWLMYYSTRLGDSTTVPGLAVSYGDLATWHDRGPMWRFMSQWWDWDKAKAESPHLFQHNGVWFIFYTTNSDEPLVFQTGPSPSDTATAWTYSNRLANLDCVTTQGMVGSEYFRDPEVGSSGREYFCNYTQYWIEIRQIRWWAGDSTYFSLLTPADVVPPSAVSDLTAEMGKTRATVTWTAPGADSTTGTAAFYDLRYSSTPITEGSFSGATRIDTGPPGPAGTLECAELSGLLSCSPYYFAIKTSDADSNSSGLGNVASGQTRCSGKQEVLCAYGMMMQGPGGQMTALGNSILDQATTASAASDLYQWRLPLALSADSALVRLSQSGPGGMSLDAASLAVVSHPDSVSAFVANGDHVILGQPTAVWKITDSAGVAVPAMIPSGGFARVVSAGTAWSVDLTSGGPVSSASTSLALLVELGGGRADDATSGGGVEVQVPASAGGWTTVRVIYPRRFLEPCVVDSISSSEVRLLFDHEYLVGNVEGIGAPQPIPLSPVSPVYALSSEGGVVTSALAAADGSSLQLNEGKSVALRYPLPKPQGQMQRQAFLLVRGQRTATTLAASTRGHQGRSSGTPSFALRQNYPNPFRTSTTIGFALPVAASVSLEIYDASGRRIRTLLADHMSAGFHTVTWDGRDDGQGPVSAGIYLYRIRAGAFRSEEKMVLLP